MESKTEEEGEGEREGAEGIWQAWELLPEVRRGLFDAGRSTVDELG